MPVRAIVGLGNPGREYDGTRHNIGFAAVDQLALRGKLNWRETARFCAHTASVVLAGQNVLLVKPQTFMNASGRTVGALCRYHRWSADEVCVVYDEYQIPVGGVKLSVGGSHGGHNGIRDIVAAIDPEFVRFRIGIGPSEKPPMRLTDFVLGRFTEAERTTLELAWPQILEGFERLVLEGPVRTMNHLNRRISSKSKQHEPHRNEKISGHRDPGHPEVRRTGPDAGGEDQQPAQGAGR